MKNLQYNEQEYKVLEKALITAINELERLWQIGSVNEIRIKTRLIGMKECHDYYQDNQWELVIDDSGIYLEQNCSIGSNTYAFAKRKSNGKLKIYSTIYQEDIIFLDEFDEIRNSVIDFVNEASKIKEGTVAKAQTLIDKYSQTATIDINLPETNNRQKIEVVEENGQKIGTLNFGNMLLRIITSADIEFVNKKEKESVKRK